LFDRRAVAQTEKEEEEEEEYPPKDLFRIVSYMKMTGRLFMSQF
jgi:hypothetical protein